MDKSLVEKYRKEMLEKYVGISSAEAAPAAAMNVKPTETDEKTAPSEKGRLSAWVTSVANIYPVKNARVTVFTGSPDNMTVVDSFFIYVCGCRRNEGPWATGIWREEGVTAGRCVGGTGCAG